MTTKAQEAARRRFILLGTMARTKGLLEYACKFRPMPPHIADYMRDILADVETLFHRVRATTTKDFLEK